MTLDLQIITLIFSFFFGAFFSLFLRLNYKIIYHSSKFIKLFGSFLIVIITVLGYFLVLQYLDNAKFHPYHLLLLILGFTCSHILEQKIVKKLKK